MRRPNKKIQTEIAKIIKEINETSIAKEMHQHKTNISYKMVALNFKTIVTISELVKALNSNVHVHSELFIRTGAVIKKVRKWLIIVGIIGITGITMSIITLILTLLK